MPKQSAGILLYRKTHGQLQFFLVHPGGPFFKNKDSGAWSIPKGEFTDDEEAIEAAKREFTEETGHGLTGDLAPLTPVKLKSGKTIYAWAAEGDVDASNIKSNTFEIEWPPKSGKLTEFPEVDLAGWFNYEEALMKINVGQVDLINEVRKMIGN